MQLINFSKPYINLEEVDRVINLAIETNELDKLMSIIKDSRLYFAREQYNQNAIPVWNYFRKLIIQRFSKINKNELSLAGKILSKIFQRINRLLPEEDMYFGGKVVPLVLSHHSKKHKAYYHIKNTAMNKTAPISIINLPAEEIESYWHWSILGHEAGHYLWIMVKDLKEKFPEKIKGVLFNKIKSKIASEEKMNIINSWSEEFFADVFAVLAFDAAAILTQMHFYFIDTLNYQEYTKHPPVKYRILLQLYILDWLETRPTTSIRKRDKCLLFKFLYEKWQLITSICQDKQDLNRGMTSLFGPGKETDYMNIIKTISEQIIEFLYSVNLKTEHLFAGFNDRVYAMINKIVPLLLDFDSQEWDNFILKQYNYNEFNYVHLIAAAAFAFELDHKKYKEIQENLVYRMRLPESQDNFGISRKIDPVFTTLEYAIFYGLDKNKAKEEDFIKKYYNIQCACCEIKIIPLEETRRVVEISQRTTGIEKGYPDLIDAIQADYLKKLVDLNNKIKEDLKAFKSNHFWKIEEINEIFKPTLNLISQWRCYRDVVLENYAGINKPEIRKIHKFFKNILHKIQFRKCITLAGYNYLIRISLDDPVALIDTIEELKISDSLKFHENTIIIDFPYSEMQNVWHWGLLAYQAGKLIFKLNSDFAQIIKERLRPNACSELENSLDDFFYGTCKKTQSNIFALKAIGPSYALCLLHLMEIIDSSHYGPDKEFEMKCQLLFTLYARDIIYHNSKNGSELKKRFSEITDNFFQKFIQHLNFWHFINFVHNGNTDERQLRSFIYNNIVAESDFRDKLNEIIITQNKKITLKIAEVKCALLNMKPLAKFGVTEIEKVFKASSKKITNIILATPLPCKEHHTFNELIQFDEKDEKLAKDIAYHYLFWGIPIHDKRYNSCHFLAAAIIAYDTIVNKTKEIDNIIAIINNNKDLLNEINNLMPDIKKIEKSDKLPELMRSKDERKKLVNAFRNIMGRLDWIRISFYHSSLVVDGESADPGSLD